MSYQGMKVLVTGADGFIGSHLTEELVRLGARVTALAQYNSFDSCGWLDDSPSEIRNRLNLIRGDIRDSAMIGRIMQEQQAVFHLAALIAIPYSYIAAQSYVDTNVLGTLNVLEAARNCGVERIVHTSTSEVYGTAQTMPISESHPLQGQSPYSASKIGADMMVESFVRSFGVPAVILRPFNTFGPRQSERAVIPTIVRQALDPLCATIMVGDTSPIRDLTYVADTVQAFLAAGSSRDIEYGRAYNAGSEKPVTVAQLIEIICDLTTCRKPVQQDDRRMRPVNSEVRALLADSTAFRRETGWRADVSLRDGLERTIEWWSGRVAAGRVRRQVDFAT